MLMPNCPLGKVHPLFYMKIKILIQSTSKSPFTDEYRGSELLSKRYTKQRKESNSRTQISRVLCRHYYIVSTWTLLCFLHLGAEFWELAVTINLTSLLICIPFQVESIHSLYASRVEQSKAGTWIRKLSSATSWLWKTLVPSPQPMCVCFLISPTEIIKMPIS